MAFEAISIKYNKHGEPRVTQCTVGDWDLTYNPDYDRFFVSERAGDHLTFATFKGTEKGWSNALYWARRHFVRKCTRLARIR